MMKRSIELRKRKAGKNGVVATLGMPEGQIVTVARVDERTELVSLEPLSSRRAACSIGGALERAVARRAVPAGAGFEPGGRCGDDARRGGAFRFSRRKPPSVLRGGVVRRRSRLLRGGSGTVTSRRPRPRADDLDRAGWWRIGRRSAGGTRSGAPRRTLVGDHEHVA